MRKVFRNLGLMLLFVFGMTIITSCSNIDEGITSYYNGENEIRITKGSSLIGEKIFWADNHGNYGRVFETGNNKYEFTRVGHQIYSGNFDTWDNDDRVASNAEYEYTLSATIKNKKLTLFYNDTNVVFSSVKGEIDDIPDDTVIVMDDKIYGFVPGCSKSVITLNQASEIVESAFYLDPTLNYVTVGEKVTKIGMAAFAYSNLKTATINANITEIPTTLFYSCDKLTSVTIKPLIKAIEENAFGKTKALEKLDISYMQGATIKKTAFYETALADIYIPDEVQTIEKRAFDLNISIYSERQESYGDEISSELASNDTNKHIFYGVKEFGVANTTNGDFKYLKKSDNTIMLISYLGKSEAVVIPSNIAGCTVKEVYWRAFDHITNLKKVYFTGTVTKLHKYSIYGCRNIEEIYIGNNVETIDGAVELACNDTFKLYVAADKAKEGWYSTWSGDAKRKNIIYSATM